MVKIFLTGASGYIGGDVLRVLVEKHPEYEISALNRDPAKAAQILDQYPSVRIVPGDLDDVDLIENEAMKADIVLNLANNHHMPCVKAINKGLARANNTGRDVYWIQISGASLLASLEIANGLYGEKPHRTFDDLAARFWGDFETLSGVELIWSLIRTFDGRELDKYMLGVADASTHLRTASVFPPIIYGVGGGPCHRRSVQVPELARFAVQRGRAARIGEGLNRWGNVHIHDLADLFGLLVEDAVRGGDGSEVWGKRGLYFCGTLEDMTFGEIAQEVANAAHEQGLIKTTEVDEISASEADELIFPRASVFLGTSAACNATRGKEKLGWQPHQVDLRTEIPNTVALEAEALKNKK